MNARGLTMIEVLVATALLALVVSACVPWLTARPSEAAERALVESVARSADALIKQSDEASKPRAELTGERSAADPLSGETFVMTIDQAEAESNRWLVFESRGVSVIRWLEPIEGEDKP